LTIGQERIAGGDIAIAVDPNNANHVVVAYTDAPGDNGAGVVQLVVTESFDGGRSISPDTACCTGRCCTCRRTPSPAMPASRRSPAPPAGTRVPPFCVARWGG
jgi:hypothetical protein